MRIIAFLAALSACVALGGCFFHHNQAVVTENSSTLKVRERSLFIPRGVETYQRQEAGSEEGWPGRHTSAPRSRVESCAIVSPMEIRGSQLIGLSLIMRHRGQ